MRQLAGYDSPCSFASSARTDFAFHTICSCRNLQWQYSTRSKICQGFFEKNSKFFHIRGKVPFCRADLLLFRIRFAGVFRGFTCRWNARRLFSRGKNKVFFPLFFHGGKFSGALLCRARGKRGKARFLRARAKWRRRLACIPYQ